MVNQLLPQLPLPQQQQQHHDLNVSTVVPRVIKHKLIIKKIVLIII